MKKARRRRSVSSELVKRFKSVAVMLVLVGIVSLVNVLISFNLLKQSQVVSEYELWYFVLQFSFITFGIILMASIVYILHYGFGAVSRIETILEKIAQGDHSFRIHLRKKDFLRPMAEKLNLVLDELEKAKKK